MIKIGSKWRSNDFTLFVVEEVKNVSGEFWVHYSKHKTNEKFSCLQEAFRVRFYPCVE